MRRRGWHWAGHRALVWFGAMVLVTAYLAWATHGFQSRPSWFDTRARLETVR